MFSVVPTFFVIYKKNYNESFWCDLLVKTFVRRFHTQKICAYAYLANETQCPLANNLEEVSRVRLWMYANVGTLKQLKVAL